MDDDEFVKKTAELFMNRILNYEDGEDVTLLADITAELHDGRILRIQLKEAE